MNKYLFLQKYKLLKISYDTRGKNVRVFLTSVITSLVRKSFIALVS